MQNAGRGCYLGGAGGSKWAVTMMKETIQQNDVDALAAFAGGEPGAFGEIVRRHVDLVYSAARRQVRDAHLAEDVTQVVFCTLAAKASALAKQREALCLPAWLLGTARLAALAALRGKGRRERHERQAAEMRSAMGESQPDEAWREMEPLLDEAMAGLGETDRRAVVLRFFQDLPMREVGAQLGVSEDAAKQRVSRAVEKLRGLFARRGVAMSAGAVATTLAANAVHAAPAGLAGSVTAAATGSVAAGLALKGSVIVMGAKAKSLATAGVVVLLLGGSTGYLAWSGMKEREAAKRVERVVVVPPPQPAATGKTDAQLALEIIEAPAGWEERFQQAYRLAAGENLKRMAPPYIPEREAYFRKRDQQRMLGGGPPTGSPSNFVDEGGHVRLDNWPGRRPTVDIVLRSTLAIPSYKVTMDDFDRMRDLPGDYVVRPGLTDQQKLDALAGILKRDLKWAVRFEPREEERAVIVAKGKYRPRPPTPAEGEFPMVKVFLDPKAKRVGMNAGDMKRFLRGLGEMADVEFIDETEGAKSVFWSNHVGGAISDAHLDELLRNVEGETGLKFERGRRMTLEWGVVGE